MDSNGKKEENLIKKEENLTNKTKGIISEFATFLLSKHNRKLEELDIKYSEKIAELEKRYNKELIKTGDKMTDGIEEYKKILNEANESFIKESLAIVERVYEKLNNYYTQERGLFEKEREEFKRTISSHVDNDLEAIFNDLKKVIAENSYYSTKIKEQLELSSGIKTDYDLLKKENETLKGSIKDLLNGTEILEKLVSEKEDILMIVNEETKKNSEFREEINNNYKKALDDYNEVFKNTNTNLESIKKSIDEICKKR